MHDISYVNMLIAKCQQKVIMQQNMKGGVVSLSGPPTGGQPTGVFLPWAPLCWRPQGPGKGYSVYDFPIILY